MGGVHLKAVRTSNRALNARTPPHLGVRNAVDVLRLQSCIVERLLHQLDDMFLRRSRQFGGMQTTPDLPSASELDHAAGLISHLMVCGRLIWQEALPWRRDKPGSSIASHTHTLRQRACQDSHMHVIFSCVMDVGHITARKTTHVCLGFDSTSPSSRTMPTPTLLADPSMPSTRTMPKPR